MKISKGMDKISVWIGFRCCCRRDIFGAEKNKKVTKHYFKFYSTVLNRNRPREAWG